MVKKWIRFAPALLLFAATTLSAECPTLVHANFNQEALSCVTMSGHALLSRMPILGRLFRQNYPSEFSATIITTVPDVHKLANEAAAFLSCPALL